MSMKHLRVKSAIFLSVFVACTLIYCEGKPTEVLGSSPNIIFIMADDLGYGDIEPYGQQLIETPNLAEMASNGLVFTQFYAGTSVCAPSRASLLTGKHTGHTRIRGNRQQGYRNGQMPLLKEQLTLAEVLKASGYTTGMVGKWGLGNPNTTGNPLTQGFDFYYGYTDQILAHNYFPEYLWRNGKKEFLDNTVVYQDSTRWHEGLGSTSKERNTYSNHLFTKESIEFIKTNQDSPFFLYLPLTLPHDNGEQTPNEMFEVPDQGIYEERSWTKNQKDYAAMVSRIDRTVGQIRKTLQEMGLAKNTLLIFTSDNGPYRNHPTTDFFDSNGKLRGGKRDLYEGGIRVPFIAEWSGAIAPNTTTAHAAGFWDVMATVADITNYEDPIPIDGNSFLPTLLGKNDQKEHDGLYWEFHGGSTSLQAVRKGDYKLISFYTQGTDSVRKELYQLSSDLGETQNIGNSNPEIVKQLDSMAKAMRSPSEYFEFPKK